MLAPVNIRLIPFDMLIASAEMEPAPDLGEEVKAIAVGGRRAVEKENISYISVPDYDKPLPKLSLSYPSNGRVGVASIPVDRERFEAKSSYSGSTSQRVGNSSYSQNSVDIEEKVQKVSPPRRKGGLRDQKLDKLGNWMKNDGSGSDLSTSSFQQQNTGNYSNPTGTGAQDKSELTEGDFNEILKEEEALIAVHRKETEDTMEIVRDEMKLLAEVDLPGSLIDNYVIQLSFLLSRKAATLVSLQAHLTRFQHRLKEQEILSRKRVLH